MYPAGITSAVIDQDVVSALNVLVRSDPEWYDRPVIYFQTHPCDHVSRHWYVLARAADMIYHRYSTVVAEDGKSILPWSPLAVYTLNAHILKERNASLKLGFGPRITVSGALWRNTLESVFATAVKSIERHPESRINIYGEIIYNRVDAAAANVDAVDGNVIPPKTCAMELNGTACTGKSSALRKWCGEYNLNIIKAGRLGSFVAKDDNQIIALQMQPILLNFMERHAKSHIADRGVMNNWLWRYITQAMDGAYAELPAADITTHINEAIRKVSFKLIPLVAEGTIAYMRRLPAIYLVATDEKETAQRMLNRGNGSDRARAHLPGYVYAQNLWYAFIGMLCSYPLYDVSLTEDLDVTFNRISETIIAPHLARATQECAQPAGCDQCRGQTAPATFPSEILCQDRFPFADTLGLTKKGETNCFV